MYGWLDKESSLRRDWVEEHDFTGTVSLSPNSIHPRKFTGETLLRLGGGFPSSLL
jgi:hypothetical protein